MTIRDILESIKLNIFSTWNKILDFDVSTIAPFIKKFGEGLIGVGLIGLLIFVPYCIYMIVSEKMFYPDGYIFPLLKKSFFGRLYNRSLLRSGVFYEFVSSLYFVNLLLLYIISRVTIFIIISSSFFVPLLIEIWLLHFFGILP